MRRARDTARDSTQSGFEIQQANPDSRDSRFSERLQINAARDTAKHSTQSGLEIKLGTPVMVGARDRARNVRWSALEIQRGTPDNRDSK